MNSGHIWDAGVNQRVTNLYNMISNKHEEPQHGYLETILNVASLSLHLSQEEQTRVASVMGG